MKKYIPYIVIALLVLLLLAACQECSKRDKITNKNLEALTDSIQFYKNSIGTQTASIRTLQLDKNQLQKIVINKDNELASLAKEFSKIRTAVKFQTVTQFDTIQIIYKDTVPYIFDRSGKVSDKWYSFKYSSDQSGVKIDSFKTWTSANVITGTKRKWLLGEQTVKTDIILSNPHMSVTSITAAEVTIPTPWYRKWYVWLAVGAAGGFIATK